MHSITLFAFCVLNSSKAFLASFKRMKIQLNMEKLVRSFNISLKEYTFYLIFSVSFLFLVDCELCCNKKKMSLLFTLIVIFTIASALPSPQFGNIFDFYTVYRVLDMKNRDWNCFRFNLFFSPAIIAFIEKRKFYIHNWVTHDMCV